MKKNSNTTKKIFTYLIIAFTLTILSFFIYSLIVGKITLSKTEEWDGKKVATSFSKGNGNIDNPYVINNAEEYMYFKSLIESDTYESYQDKYYILGNDINFYGNNIESIGTINENEERIFKGTLDGNGYSLENYTMSNNEYYSLFTKTKNATIKNIEIKDINIKVEEDKKNIISLLVTDTEQTEDNTSSFDNILFKNFNIEIENENENNINLLINNITGNINVNNIYINGKISSKENININIISEQISNNIKNVLTDIVVNEEPININNYYNYKNDKYYLNENEISKNEIISIFNENTTNYYWIFEEEKLVLKKYEEVKNNDNNVRKFSFSIKKSSAITIHDSGIEDETVYINDLESDYNYYTGLNYTKSSNGTMPTGLNQNIFNNSSLVPVYMKYKGTNIENTYTGYVSNDELYSDIVYYKYYKVENNMITIPIIDNPYSKRPNKKAFNGWITDYEGAVISYDHESYTRYLKIPISQIEPISITMYATWIEATEIDASTTHNYLNTVELKDATMQPIIKKIPQYSEELEDLYIQGSVTSKASRNGSVYYPGGAVDEYGDSLENSTCDPRGSSRVGYTAVTCYYYIRVRNNINQNNQYYYLNNGRMSEYTFPEIIDYTYENIVDYGNNLAGYYKKKTITFNYSKAGYYNIYGEYQDSGVCDKLTCDYYELIQYSDNTLLQETDPNDLYYYLVTRDTNIAILKNNITGFSNDKPLTITGIDNDTNNSNRQIQLNNGSIYSNSDLRIEHLTLYTTYQGDESGPSYTTNNYIYGNFHNLKIGRGIIIRTSGNTAYLSARGIAAGNNESIQNTTPKRYHLIVESGYYNSISGVGTTSVSAAYFVDGKATYGNDIDRVTSNNDSFRIYYTMASSWGGTVYNTSTEPFMNTTVKSGTIGQLPSIPASGIYVGGLNGGTIESPSTLTIEGGKITNINGGPLISTNLRDKNVTYLNFKGGEANFIFGGAAVTETYGNRIINITGGTINYSVFGGSNGYKGNNNSNSKGTLNGKSFIYVGGNSIIGTANNTIYGAEAGSIFGAGNGNKSYSSIGSVNDSKIIIDKNAIINNNVYGGGNYGAVVSQNQSTSNTTINVIGGTINGSIYGGGNNNGSGSSSVTSSINLLISNGTINNSVYGGSKTKGIVYGNTEITVTGGTINHDIYGGGEGGYTDSNSKGTYVRDNVEINIEDGLIEGNIYGGSAYGTVNAIAENTTTTTSTTNVIINGGVIRNNVYGGGKGSNNFTPKVVGNITVTVNDGSIGKVFGGFDASSKPTNSSNVYLYGGTIGDVYGGGNNTGQNNTNVLLDGSIITGNLYGGSNQSGTVNQTNVEIKNGQVTDVYGGNNLAGTTIESNINIIGGTITNDIYGGGNESETEESNIDISNTSIQNLYGGGKRAGVTNTIINIDTISADKIFGGSNISGNTTTSNITCENSNINNLFGSNNQGGKTTTTNILVNSGVINNIYGGGDNASTNTSNITINDGNIENIYGGGNEAGLTTSNITINKANITNLYGGSNQSGNITSSNIIISNDISENNIIIENLYGGNNQGGQTTTTNIEATKATINTLFGGGKNAPVENTNLTLKEIKSNNIYGGGDRAKVSGNTLLDIDDSIVENNIYGGGNEAVVENNTKVFITNSHIKGNAYGGGNGQTAIVYKNTEITIDGETEIGIDSNNIPNSGCVFGSGNKASTGTNETNDSKAIVNIVGGLIHGNVYGGSKMAVVYGKTNTNIGKNTITSYELTENDIIIEGTIFGGSESNDSGSEIYDWTFISVTEGITVSINGEGYKEHNHLFKINGSIFGSGNASSSEGESKIYIKKLGSKDNINQNVSIQRADLVTIDSSYIELFGTTDRTNEYSDMKYSFNRIDKLIIKNQTTLLLQHNANMLKELYSGKDEDDILVPAEVEIDDENKEVIRNVDNRIYMIPNQNLNITINEAATAYGKITGMTFFGMYVPYDNGTYRFGLYDDTLNYGDATDASKEIIGGSYIIGLRNINHDIEKDGFYSNYLSEDYEELLTKYVNPTPIGETGYRFIIGFEAINYNFTLTATKYSSLGTYELQLIDFSQGDTSFYVLGCDTTTLNSEISLVDSQNVPRVGKTIDEANNILGLSMKAETQEWTGYGTTKILTGNEQISGTKEYKTDSKKTPPSLMFYLYHAKNITKVGQLGTIIITLRAEIPKNEIEYDIKFITITIDLLAKKYEDVDSYDASITYDKKYEMPSPTLVNITNQSQFSTYYSLISWTDRLEEIYGNNNTNYHVLTTNNPLPVNTMITMIDFSYNSDKPIYYYLKITEDLYQDSLNQLQQYNEITYRLSNFIKMGSTSSNNKYNDQESNLKYFKEEDHIVFEEFMFIFDFKNTNLTGTHLNNSMLFELRNQEDRSVINVLGIRQNIMNYNMYDTSNVVLDQIMSDVDQYLYYNSTEEIGYKTEIKYNETENRQSVIDTNYESSNMGINIEIFDKDGYQVSSSLLVGTNITIDDSEYYADSDGVFRIKLANKVSNLNKIMKITVGKDLPAGEYTMKYTLFASDDGLHNSLYHNSVSNTYNVILVSKDNAIVVTTEDKTKIVNQETSQNMLNTNINKYVVNYESQLINPNFRVEIFLRNKDIVDTTEYTSIPFNNLFKNRLTRAHGNEVYINMGEQNIKEFNFELNDNLETGTYKIVFKLYDNNQYIDDDIKYIIVKKKVE